MPGKGFGPNSGLLPGYFLAHSIPPGLLERPCQRGQCSPHQHSWGSVRKGCLDCSNGVDPGSRLFGFKSQLPHLLTVCVGWLFTLFALFNYTEEIKQWELH